MQYLSQRLLATKTKKPRGEQTAHRPDVAADQRQRLLAATEQLIAERGCPGATIERIAKRARVSSVTFYDHFAGKEDAFVAAFERASGEARVRLQEETPAGLPWPEQIRAGLRVLLVEIAANPERAKLCLVEAPRGGPQLLAHYERTLDRAVLKLREGRLFGSVADDLPAATEETTAAGLAWLLRERLETAGAEGIERMLPELIDVALRPFIGSAEALRLGAVAGGE
jgi:AcrR family transcriptional regulator